MTVPLLSPVRVSLSDYKEWPPEDNDLAAAAESLARDAVANCATRILIPELAWGMRQFNMSLDVGKLAPSAKRRITIVDRHDQTWKAILAYFRPIRSQLMDGRPYSPVVDELNMLAHDLHLLALASIASAQVYINPLPRLAFVNSILSDPSRVSGEAAIRLAMIRGLFSAMAEREMVPGLAVIPRKDFFFRERISEILEDAYLAEASSLRRFFSLESNKASIKRDLRRVLRAIVSERAWAQATVTAVEHSAVLPRIITAVLSPILKAIDVTATGGPIVLNLHEACAWCDMFRQPDGRVRWLSPRPSLWDTPEFRPMIGWRLYDVETQIPTNLDGKRGVNR